MTLPTTLHLGCGEDYQRGEHNVDVVESVNPDEVVDLEDIPWPWADESFKYIHASHVFEHLEDIEAALRECERVLRPGGKVKVAVPAGNNKDADRGHKWGRNGRPWTWQTPDFYCGKRHWDIDVGLRVVEKSVELHTHYSFPPFQAFHHIKWWIERWWNGDGEWCFNQPAASGELRVVFEKP